MYRNIYVGENYSRKITTPLITTDCNAYKIIWDSKAEKGIFKITAIRADDTSVFDYGELAEDGTATYIMNSNMYSKEGPLTLYLSICDQETVVTCREMLFNVKDTGNTSEVTENNIDPINKLTQQIVKNQLETEKRINNLTVYGEDNIYILEENVDVTIKDGKVTDLLNTDYSEYETIAFPYGISEIAIPEKTEFIANKVIMPKGLEKVADGSFSKKASDNVKIEIKEIIFNEGITEIGASVFSYANIGNIRFADSLKTVKENAFLGTSGLKEIVLPENVDEVGNYVGMDSSIEKIVFKNNVTKIGALVFSKLKVCGYEGSTAEEFAKNISLEFQSIAGESALKKVKIDNLEYVSVFSGRYYEIKPQNKIIVLLGASADTSRLDEYMFSFETPEDISEFSFSVIYKTNEIVWVKEPRIKNKHIYEVSVVNGVGVIVGTPLEVTL